MAQASSFTFDSMSRIGNDQCSMDQNTIQNVEACNYLLENYGANDGGMNRQIKFATSQPGIFYSGGNSMAVNGSNVDQSNSLLLGSINAHPRCRIDLFQRPFATVPFLGRGSVDPILEAQMQQGELLTNRRTVNRLAEQSYAKYVNTPMLKSVHDRVTDPRYCVEGVASSGWVRGGVPSRDLNREVN